MNDLSNPRRGYTDGPFGQIHYKVAGEGPLVLLLHQAPMTSGQFDPIYGPLARRGFRVAALDLPGFGQSDPAPHTPTIADYAQAIPPVLAALGARAAVLAGHHTGAMVAAEAALAWPDQTLGAVMHGPLVATEEEREAFFNGWHLAERRLAPEEDGGHFVRLFRGRARLAAGTIPLSRLSEYVIQALSGQGAYWHGHHAAYTYDLAGTLTRMSRPALLMGNTGDPLFEHLERAHDLRPDLPNLVLEGGGVDIIDQAPEAWSQALADFAKTCAPG